MHVKFEVRSFNRFGAVSIYQPKYLGGHVTLATPLFEKNLWGHVRTVPWNMRVKFEVRSFNRFKLVWLTGPLRTDTQTDRHTSNENSISAIHIRSFGGDNSKYSGTTKLFWPWWA